MARKLGSDSEAELQPPQSIQTASKDCHPTDASIGTSSTNIVSRRRYLSLGGAATVAALGLSAPAVSATSIEREGITFAQTIDAVDDLGMDPTGDTSVIPQIQEIPPDTLVEFPDGTYLIDERVDLPNMGNVGFEAVGEAIIKGAPGFGDTSWNVSNSNAVYYAGFVHDQSEGAVGHYWRVSDSIELHDVDVVGRAGPWAVELCPTITEPDGLARIVNYTNKQGSSWAEYNSGGSGADGRIGCWLGSNHVGTIQFIDCDFREYGNNALYCAAATGPVQVIDSYFENNNVASVRIGGKGSYVENTTIVVDEDRYTGPRRQEDESTSFFMRGVLIHENLGSQEQKPAGAEIRNCKFIFEDNPTNGPAIEVWANGRSLEIRDTEIQYNNDGTAAIRREDYRTKAGVHPPGEDPRWLRLYDSVITGTGSVPAVIDIEDGDGSEIHNTHIAMYEAESVNGITIARSNDCVIENSTVYVSGEPITTSDAEVDLVNFSESEPPIQELSIASAGKPDESHQGGNITPRGNSTFSFTGSGTSSINQEPMASSTNVSQSRDGSIFHRLGVLGVITSIGTAGYMLKREFDED